MEQQLSAAPLVFQLEPLDPSRLRALDDKSIFRTFQGKQNRSAVARPRCIRETTPSRGGLLTKNDLKSYPAQKHSFYRISTQVTLVPDRDCRFRSADLVFDFEEHAGGKSLPFVVRLRPQEQASKKVVKVENKGEAELAASDPVAKSFSVKLGDSETRTDEITRMLVELASFDPGTQQAGRRFQLTESRDIALSSPERGL